MLLSSWQLPRGLDRIWIEMSQIGMCIMEHLEVLEYAGIFISNPEYRILFRNNSLGAKWADRAEVWNAEQRPHNLLISLFRHHTVPWACWVFLSLAQERKECHCKIYWGCKTYLNHLFCRLCNFSRAFNSNLFRI